MSTSPPFSPAPRGWLQRSADNLGDTFIVYRNSNYLWYWIASFAYYIGFFTDIFAIGYLAYEMTGSAVMLGTVVVSQGVPMAALSVIGGTLADRVSKRKLLLWSQVVLAIVGAMLFLLLVTGYIEFWHLIVLSLAKGVAVGFSLPARLSYVSEIVPQAQFSRAYGLYYVALNSMRIGGPGFGGIIAGVFGVQGAYFVIAISHIIGLFALLFVRPQEKKEPRKPSPLMQDMLQIYHFARRTPTILVLLGAEMGLVFFAISAINLMPVFTKEEFAVGATGLGTLLAIQGVGGLLGSFATAVGGGIQRKPLMLLIAGAAMGASLIFFANAPVYGAALLLAIPLGFTSAAYTTFNSTLFQISAPPEMRGRAMSLYLLGQSLQPLGLIPISVAADVVGFRLSVSVAGGILILYMMFIAVLFPRFRQQRV